MLLALSSRCLLPKQTLPETDAIGHRSPFCEQFRSEWSISCMLCQDENDGSFWTSLPAVLSDIHLTMPIRDAKELFETRTEGRLQNHGTCGPEETMGRVERGRSVCVQRISKWWSSELWTGVNTYSKPITYFPFHHHFSPCVVCGTHSFPPSLSAFISLLTLNTLFLPHSLSPSLPLSISPFSPP